MNLSDSNFDELAKRADDVGKAEIHPVSVYIDFVAADLKDAEVLAKWLDSSPTKHRTGDYLVRVSGREAAELGAYLTPRMKNESQIKLLSGLHSMWKADKTKPSSSS